MIRTGRTATPADLTHRSSNEPPPGPPPSGPPAAPVAAQTDVWTGILTPVVHDGGNGFGGIRPAVSAGGGSAGFPLGGSHSLAATELGLRIGGNGSVSGARRPAGPRTAPAGPVPPGAKRLIRTGTYLARAAAVAGLLALAALAAPRAAAQTDVWTATLTPADLGRRTLGCDNSSRILSDRCSRSTVLSDDDFTHDSTDYTVTALTLRGRRLTLTVDEDITTATNALSLVLDGTSLSLADAGQTSNRTRTWTSTGLSWTEDTAVSVSLTGTSDTTPPDTTPPVLTSATVSESGENIALVFTEAVEQPDNGPPASAFAVTVDGSAVTVTDVLPSNEGEGLLAVAPPIRQGQAVVVTYTDPTTGDDANAIQDAAGNDAASFTTGSDGVPAVTNESTVTQTDDVWTATLTPADLGRRTLGCDNSSRTLSDRCSRSTVLSDDDFTHDSTDYTVTALTLRGRRLTLTVDEDITTATNALSLVLDGTILSLANADQTSNRTRTWTSTGLSWTEDTAVSVSLTATSDTTPPVLTSATVSESGENIALVFTEVVEQQTGPPASAFAVTVDGSAVTVTDVPYTNVGEGLIAVAPPIRQGLAVVVTYTDPTTGDDANAIQDAAGNDAASFTTGSDGVPVVTNESTVATKAPANWSLTPTGLATGAKFRLLFLSSTKRDALSTDIADYNTFVQARAAAGHADIQAYSAGFRAVGCTSDTDARDNTLTTFTGDDKGVPIYWLDGAKAAADYEDFYDGSWDDEVSDKNESGADAHDTSQEANFPATGCKHDGTEAFRSSAETVSRGLGATAGFMRLGRPNSSGNLEGPIDGNHTARTDSDRSMYGLSALFEVDATPPALTRATVDDTGLVIELEFSEHLQSKNLPPASAFTVTADGTAVTVSAVTKRKIPDVFQISVSSHITLHQSVVLAYADPTTGNDAKTIQDAVGNDARDFTTGRNGVPVVINNSDVAAAVPANWSLKPAGLAVSARFRLLFLSSTRRDALAPDIADYNTFFQDLAAAGHAAIQAYSAGFRVVGCTEDTDARDNTSTTYTETAKGVPVYWLNGAKAADDYEDFYDGSWDEEANNKNESGVYAHDTSDAFYTPFTGCWHDGTEKFNGGDSRALGNSLRAPVTVGVPNSNNPIHGPIESKTGQHPDETLPMYGLSQVLQVAAAVAVNTPPAFSAANAARSLAENTAAGQNVGAALTATDADSHTLTYTLGGADAASFDMVTISASAQIRTKTGVTYNHEAKSSYTVMVTASDGAGGTATVTVTITVTDVDEPPGRPAAPSVTAAAESTTSLDVTWTAPSNTGPAITSYDLQYRQGASGNFTDGPQDVTGTSAAIGSLAPVTSYQVQVRATNAEGDGAWSFSGTGQTKSVPGAPTNLSAAAGGNTRINLSWTAPASTGGSAITGYKIEVSSDGGSSWTNLVANTGNPSTTYSDTGLPAGVTRHYRVSAINTNGAGLPSNVDDATTAPSVPGAPANLSAMASGNTRINLTWTAPASDGDSSITGYKIEVSSDGGSNWTTLVADTTNTNTTYSHTGLPGGTTRHYRVSAINAVGTGLPSDTAGTTTGSTVPGAPSGLQATASGTTRIDLTWTAPGSDGGSPITGYKIESSPDGTSNWTNLVVNTRNTNTTYSDTGLLGGTTRHYRVSAINTHGTGATSNVASASTGLRTVRFEAELYTATEGGAAATVAVVLSAAASETVTIPLTTEHLSGATAEDYSGVPEGVRFAAGQARQTFTVTATDDRDEDGLKRLRLRFGTTLPSRYVPGSPRTAIVRLVDNDAGSLLVNFDTERHTTVKVREHADVRHRFSVSLRTNRYGPPNNNLQQTVTIPLVVTHVGGATEEDYTPVIPADVTFAVGQSEASFSMRAIPDGKREPGEGLRIDFGELPPGVTRGDWGPYETVEFVDQVLPEYTAWFGAAEYTATEGGAAAGVAIHLNEPVDIEPVEVRLQREYGGGATEDDHESIPTVVRFAVGDRTKTITVTATDDTDDDDGESVTLSFVNDPNDGVSTGNGPNSATVALEDNDGAERVTVSFGAVTYTATEGGAGATVSVELDAAPGRSVTVPLTKADIGGATPADYSGIPGSVTFAANQTATTFTVTATDDQIGDGGESVSIGFGTLPEGVFAGSPAAATVTLADGSEQRFEVSFNSANVQVREGARRLRLSVQLGNRYQPASGNPQRPVTIPLVVTPVGGATEADYAAIPKSVTFAEGQGSAPYYVQALPDEEDETGEGLRIDFGPLPPGVTKGDYRSSQTIDFVDAGAAAANLSVAGPLLTLGYPGALDGGSTPSGGDFVVLGEAPRGQQAMVAVTAVSVRGSDVFLELDPPVAPDETVTLSYLAAAMHPIRDAAGLSAPPLADEPVRNDTGADDPLAEAALPAPLAALSEEALGAADAERLDLSSRNLTDLSALAGLSGLRELDLRHNAIADLSPLAGLTGLQRLYLSGNRIEELWPLAGLTALEQLNLSDNRIADLSPLAGLSGLQVLDLAGNRIEELWPLAGLSGLEVLLLDRNRVADLSALSPLAELANLGLSGNRIADIGRLSELGRLRRLDLSGNAVANLSALGDVSGLVWLRLPGNPVSDVAPLGRLEKLLWLWLDSGTAAGMEALAPPAGRVAAPLWIEPTPGIEGDGPGPQRTAPGHKRRFE